MGGGARKKQGKDCLSCLVGGRGEMWGFDLLGGYGVLGGLERREWRIGAEWSFVGIWEWVVG